VETQHWVFGYGSLVWRPGFDFAERRRARLNGRHRAFCIYSVHHRGTYDRPGLVLGLAPGGAVVGRAYRVSERDWPDVHAYLLEREQPTETYVERRVDVTLEDGVRTRALSFLSDRSHPQWAGALPFETQAQLIAGACGLSGPNIDYLRDLVAHLRADGVCDAFMGRLLDRVEALQAATQRTSHPPREAAENRGQVERAAFHEPPDSVGDESGGGQRRPGR
jgi:cation transport protein ChaC